MFVSVRSDEIDKILKGEKCLAWNAALLEGVLSLRFLPVY